MKKNMLPLLKEAAITLGLAENKDFTSSNLVKVLKELAVAINCAKSVSDIETNSISGVLDYIAKNGESIIYPEPTGTKAITKNGIYDVKDYANAEVAVPNPSTGSINITANGTYDVTEKASAVVNVSSVTPYKGQKIKLVNSSGRNITVQYIGVNGYVTEIISANHYFQIPVTYVTSTSVSWFMFFKVYSGSDSEKTASLSDVGNMLNCRISKAELDEHNSCYLFTCSTASVDGWHEPTITLT